MSEIPISSPRGNPWRETGFSIAREALNTFTNSAEWNRICLTDPHIQLAEHELEVTISEVIGEVGHEKLSRLLDAQTNVENRYIDAAILFGMRAALAIYETIQDPVAFSGYVVEELRKEGILS